MFFKSIIKNIVCEFDARLFFYLIVNVLKSLMLSRHR
ncbi:MAG: hypothetical protein J6O15_09240 [Acinetobacter sp.]|nr:hypothetical protein [Acinetobacter sp.]